MKDYIEPSERIGRRNPNPDDYGQFMGELERRRNPCPHGDLGNTYRLMDKIIDASIILFIAYLLILIIRGI